MGKNMAGVLLDAEQIRRFICDGFLVFQPDVDEAVHAIIDERFNWLIENESNPGNNILPRLPELNKILECAVVRGAIASLLGEHYLRHPHCYWHDRPADGKTLTDEDIKNAIRRGTHQDSYTPADQGRSHCLQYLRFMYYSHDVELENGPTYVIAGSQYHAALSDGDRARNVPVTGKAGTVFISHFDIGHSGGPNLSSRCRNMIKFIYTRAQEPERPCRVHMGVAWDQPDGIGAPHALTNCWKWQWNWLCGKAATAPGVVSDPASLIEDLANANDLDRRLTLIQEIGETRSPAAVPVLLAFLNEGRQAERTTSIYALAEIGVPAIEHLVRVLAETEETAPGNDSAAMNDACYALSAIGEPCITALLPLLSSPRECSVISAVHVLSDIGENRQDVRAGLENLLDSSCYRIIYHATNALGSVGAEESISALCAVLDRSYDTGSTNEFGWSAEWQIHFNAALALARMGRGLENHEDEIAKHLDHAFGQVGICLTEALKRIGSQSALRTIVDHLGVRRWDAALDEAHAY